MSRGARPFGGESEGLRATVAPTVYNKKEPVIVAPRHQCFLTPTVSTFSQFRFVVSSGSIPWWSSFLPVPPTPRSGSCASFNSFLNLSLSHVSLCPSSLSATGRRTATGCGTPLPVRAAARAEDGAARDPVESRLSSRLTSAQAPPVP